MFKFIKRIKYKNILTKVALVNNVEEFSHSMQTDSDYKTNVFWEAALLLDLINGMKIKDLNYRERKLHEFTSGFNNYKILLDTISTVLDLIKTDIKSISVLNISERKLTNLNEWLKHEDVPVDYPLLINELTIKLGELIARLLIMDDVDSFYYGGLSRPLIKDCLSILHLAIRIELGLIDDKFNREYI